MRVPRFGLLLLLLPALAFAQPAPQVVRSVDLLTPPGSATFGVAHVEDVRIGEARQIHTIVTTNEGEAEITFDGRTMRFGDGYTIVRETLANARGVLVLRLTASTPEGLSESAIVVYNRKSAETTSIGIDRYAVLLQGSREARLAQKILPLVASAPSAHSSELGAKISYLGDCLMAGLAVEAASVGVIVGCGSGNPAACTLALYGLAAAWDSFMGTCPATSYDDGTIGWG